MQNDLISILAYVSLVLPLLSFLTANSLKDRIPTKYVLYVCVVMICAAALSIDVMFCNFYQSINSSNACSITLPLWEWLNVAHIHANLVIYMDMLSGIMCILVLNVSALVHIYSIGYMSDDQHQEKFISYLSLFTFFMLLLVLSDNFLQMFIGWEGVGLCSYLLIGFWYHKRKANKAAMKAFIVNRVGDVGLVLGMAMMLVSFGSVEFSSVLNHNNIANVLHSVQYHLLGINLNAVDIICGLLFIGCMGKSAQLLLHVWLPDAMEGPTPVSALIHAATMVTAGVFLVARCSPLFEQSEITLNAITVVGALTAMFAATVALVQSDIKKIIAYSTCSQLGYMFFACGVSAYGQGIFHLFTHGFFKALLFLSAGSVIHGMNGEQNVHKMGGVRKYMQFTYAMMLIGSLALTGIFPFAGFYSKDAILEGTRVAATMYGNFAYYTGLIVALLTAFYSWRLIILVFERPAVNPYHHPHESDITMLMPLAVLAVGAVSAGLIGQWLGVVDHSMKFWHGSIFVAAQHWHPDAGDAGNILYEWLPMTLGILGIIFAHVVYSTKIHIALNVNCIKRPLQKAYYFDVIYQYIFVNPIRKSSLLMWKCIDNKIIDGMLALLIGAVQCCVVNISKMHTGNVQHYAMMSLFIISMFFYGLLLDSVGLVPNITFWNILYGGIIVCITSIPFIKKYKKY